MTSKYQKVLVVGAGGNLARALISLVPPRCAVVPLDHASLDITDEDAIARALRRHDPDIVFNGAAYNLVDEAEGEGAQASLQLNSLGPSRLAKGCEAREIPLVHFSTDFVFEGHKRTPYMETDAAVPLSVYGRTKLMGENLISVVSPRHFIIRVCRLFGPVPADKSTQKPSGNFPLLMLNLAKERDQVRVVNDQTGSPSYTPDLARAVWQLVENGAGGLYQLSNAGEVSFADYARAIFEIAGVECAVEGVSSEDYGAAAQRPLYSTMSNAKAEAAGVTPLRDWREALAEFLTG